jgi:hypothetical protein
MPDGSVGFVHDTKNKFWLDHEEGETLKTGAAGGVMSPVTGEPSVVA